MKKYLIALMLLLAGRLSAQTTAVSATVVDSDGTTWANGTWSLSFSPNNNFPNPNQYTINGAPLDPAILNQKGSLTSSGALAITTYDSSLITPGGSGWNLTVCPNATAKCGLYTFSTAGASNNISASLTINIPPPRFVAKSGTYGYADGEATLQLVQGATYWNVTTLSQKTWTGTVWQVTSSSSTGTVNSGTTGQITGYPANGTTVGPASGLTTYGTNGLKATGKIISEGPVYDAQAMGLACDGVTDDTAALNTADATIQAAGGGTLRFPNSVCLIAGHVVLPNNNTAACCTGTNPYSQQAPLHWQGTSNDLRNGQRYAPFSSGATWSGTMLKLTYAGSGTTGPIAEQSVFSGGSGYAVGDTGTVGGTCSGATYRIAAVDTGSYTVGTARSTLTHTGWVQQVYISAPGTGCTIADNTVTAIGGTQPGAGTGLTLNLMAVTGGSFAKIETYGLGTFEMDHFTLYDPGADTLPFLRSTGTTLNIHDNLIWGTGNKQDALILGGSSNAFVTLNNPVAFWQGYNSKIQFNNFSKIRRATYTQGFSAATLINDNLYDTGSGTNIPEGSAFESNNPLFDSVSGAANSGNGGENFYTFNRCEMTGVYYCFKFFNSDSNYIAGTDVEDANLGSVTPLAVINYNTSQFNVATVHVTSGLPPEVYNSTGSFNTLTTNQQDYANRFPTGIIASGGTGASSYAFVAGPTYNQPTGYDGSIAIMNTTPATVSTVNQIVLGFESMVNHWNGTISEPDRWYFSHQASSGTNTQSIYTLNHSGTSGPAKFYLPNAVYFGGSQQSSFDSSGQLTLTGNTNINGQVYISNNTTNIRNTVAATSGANQSSPYVALFGAYWNGSASAADEWYYSGQAGTGTNPTSTLQFVHTGSPGYASVLFPAIKVATARKGTFVCTAGGTITIANTNELATSDVIISLNTAGGTISTPPAMTTVTAATGFTVLCGAADTSTYNYTILN
jgi:hypothetical protein